MIAKRIINVLVPEDAEKQCARDPDCHRLDGHGGGCKTFAVVLVEKAEHAARRLVARIRGAS